MGKTKISWTDETWNPIVGCSVVSPGCKSCYAMRMAARLEAMSVAHEAKHGGDPGPLVHYRGTTEQSRAGAVWTGKIATAGERTLTAPLRWRKPRRVFVNSMGDLFHKDVPDAWIDQVFAVMALTARHTYQVLTKRPERMRDYVSRLARTINPLEKEARALGHTFNFEGHSLLRWPIPNVWLGTSVEDQKRADERIPALLDTPAAVRFLSCEPLLGSVNLRRQVDWVICGGESGPGARHMDPAWARWLRDQCRAARVPFFMKQMARKGPIPDDLMVREFPA